jgi:MFS family permease
MRPSGSTLALRRSAPWLALSAAVVTQTTVSLAEMGIPTLAPFFKEGFGLSAAGVGVVVSSLNLGRIFGSFPAGRLVDRIGETHVMVGGGVGAGLLFCAAAAGGPAWALAGVLVAAGVFTGSAAPAGTKFIFSAFPPLRRGLPMGIRQSAVPLGGLVAAATLPWLAAHHGLRAALLASAGALLLGAASARLGMRAIDGHAAGEPAGEDPPPHTRLGSIDPNLRRVIVWAMLFIGGQYAVVAYLILDLTGSRGLSLGTATALLAVAQAGGVAGRIFWGVVSDRWLPGRRKLPLLLITATGIACAALLAAWPGHARVAVLAPVCLLTGASLIGWQGVWTNLVSELAPRGLVGTAVGFGLTFTNVAIVAWPPLFGLIADVTGSFRVSWAVLAGALLASAGVVARVAEPHPEHGRSQ